MMLRVMMELADINSLGLLDSNILPVQVGFTLNTYCVRCQHNLLVKKAQYYMDLLKPQYNILKIIGTTKHSLVIHFNFYGNSFKYNTT